VTQSINIVAIGRHLQCGTSLAALVLAGFCVASGPGLAAGTKPASVPTNPQVAKLLRQGQTAFQQGHPDVALIFLKNAETIDPNNPTVNRFLGDAHMEAGDPAEAAREFRSALQHGAPRDTILPLLFRAMVVLNQGQQILNEFPEPSPNDHSALAMHTLRARAFAQSQANQMDAAAASLDRALSIARTADNLEERASLAYRMGDLALATNLSDEALAKDPAHISSLILKKDLLLRAKQNDQALQVANTLVKVDHNSPFALIRRAPVYMALNQDAKALADINAVLDATPKSTGAILYKSEILSDQKDVNGAWSLAQSLPAAFLHANPDAAIAVSQMAIDAGHNETGTSILSPEVEAFPQSADLRVRLALDYLLVNDAPHAIDTLAPLSDLSDPPATALLGQAKAKANDLAPALKYLDSAVAPGNGADARKGPTAKTDIQVGSIDDAAEEFQKLSQTHTNRPELAGPLIAVLLRQGKSDAAFQVAVKLTNDAPKSPYGPFYQGQLLEQKGDMAKAIPAFSTAISRDPKFLPARYYRALGLLKNGNTHGAEADLQVVLAADPKNASVMVSHAQSAPQTGKDTKLLQNLQEAIRDIP
jgi:tetratricopeptide (TPR) repeat protein